jgi:isochorismate synthase
MTTRSRPLDLELDARLHALARQVQRQASARPVVASSVEPAPPLDPIALFARAPAGLARALWRGVDSLTLVGLGEALALGSPTRQTGCHRVPGDEISLARLAQDWRRLAGEALVDAPGDSPMLAGPLLLGGCAFDPLRPPDPAWQGFPPTRLVLPRLLLVGEGGRWWLASTLVVRPGRDPAEDLEELRRLRALLLGPGAGNDAIQPAANGWAASRRDKPADHRAAGRAGPAMGAVSPARVELCGPECWRAMVERAIEAVRRGELAKVVLARAVEVSGLEPVSVEHALRRLAEDYPGCTLFAFGHGDAVFLGATPERLIRLRGGRVETMALAGSIRRGTTPEEDAALAGTLLASAKDRREHAVVVDEIRAALAPLCHALVIPEEPSLLSVRNVHHLATPVSSELAGDHTVLELVERLHPTPAVGGAPRANALAFIRAHEPVDRGWYAGPVGWVDCAGEGEFAVALRSGLIRGRTACLYAGCGILADSDPEAEYAESELKLQPLLRALEGA